MQRTIGRIIATSFMSIGMLALSGNFTSTAYADHHDKAGHEHCDKNKDGKCSHCDKKDCKDSKCSEGECKHEKCNEKDCKKGMCKHEHKGHMHDDKKVDEKTEVKSETTTEVQPPAAEVKNEVKRSSW